MSVSRVCRVNHCDDRAVVKVFYRARVRALTTESFAKVCLFHSVPRNWPTSWGTITKREEM